MPVKNIVTNQRVTKAKLERAKELRREMTPAEKLLWQEVRASGQDKSHAHALPFREGATQHRELLR